jgi:DNA-binding HxlR family transcriptional regulator
MQTIITESEIEPSVGCIASAMEVLGQKWTALILRDLMSGPKHFCELQRTVSKINPRTLSKRLDNLKYQGIVMSMPQSGCYRLTKKGIDLLPILKQMATWGNKYPS